MAYKIGKAYAAILQGENKGKHLRIVVGNDMRLSGPKLKPALIEGLIDSGVDVVDIGLASTPTFYFAVAFYGYDGGMEVSASHNPKEYNGFKMVRKRAIPVSDESGIKEMEKLVESGRFIKPAGKGNVTKREGVLAELVNAELKEWPVELGRIKPFKIVVDASNSMGALDVDAMFKNLPCKLIKMNFELDGSFPVHEPDPMKDENIKLLSDAVLKNKADMGIAPDGDGDRYFIIDEKGEVIRQEILRGMMAQKALKTHPKAVVCYDIRPGRITKDLIEQAGGKASVTRVGHSLIKEQMIRENAVFGGESSGHYFYKFSYGTFEAPAVMVLHFLELISIQNKPLSEIVKPYKKYFHSGEINSDVADKEGKIKEIAKRYGDAKEISYLDGISVTYDDWWFNVRPSNTESKLRLNLEAKSQSLMEEKRDELLSLIRS